MLTARTVASVLAAALLGATLAAQSYVPNRVFDAPRGVFADFESMAADLATADVVFIGEQHDDPNTHRLELAVLEGLLRRKQSLVLSLEMFERDVQDPIDHFLMGHLEEAEFLELTRPWPRYATDYKPLVDLAAAHDWPVVAANVPRPIASEVAKDGLEALEKKGEAARLLFARDLACPIGDHYYQRFTEVMGGGGGHQAAGAADDAAKTLQRYYFSQCLKDETMAESIATAYTKAAATTARPIVVHVTGAFHAEYGEGTVSRTRRRLAGKRVLVISIKPVEDLDDLQTDEDRQIAQYVVYTVKQ